MKFTEIDKAILIGLLLGDGYINDKGRIEIEHCIQQKQYCIFKAKLLHSVCGGKDINVHEYERTHSTRKDGKDWKSKTFTTVSFKKQSKHFLPIRELLYRDRKKVITQEVLDLLSPLSIALWWMDDGSLVKKTQKDGNPGPYILMFYTYLSKEENTLIQKYFLEKYNMKWNVVPANIHKENQYMLRCGQTEGRKFLNIIREIVQTKVPSMQHKVIEI